MAHGSLAMYKATRKAAKIALSHALHDWDDKHILNPTQAKDLKNPPPVDQQQLNHFFNGGCLTTKTGLTASMKQLKWYRDFHQDEIFPRAYNISNPSDRQVLDCAATDSLLGGCMALQ